VYRGGAWPGAWSDEGGKGDDTRHCHAEDAHDPGDGEVLNLVAGEEGHNGCHHQMGDSHYKEYTMERYDAHRS